MQNNFLDHLFSQAQLTLTHLWLLAEKFIQLSDREITQRAKDLEILSDKINTAVSDNIESERGLTIADLRSLIKVNPEKAQFLIQHSANKIAMTWAEVEIKLLDTIFPNLVWSSLHVIGMAHFENSLRKMSDILGAQRGSRIGVNDLRGSSIIERSREFLTKVVLVNFDFGASQSWNTMLKHQQVRNLIVHNGGYLNESSFFNKAKDIDLGELKLSVNEDGFILFTKKYVQDALETASSFFEEISNSI